MEIEKINVLTNEIKKNITVLKQNADDILKEINFDKKKYVKIEENNNNNIKDIKNNEYFTLIQNNIFTDLLKYDNIFIPVSKKIQNILSDEEKIKKQDFIINNCEEISFSKSSIEKILKNDTQLIKDIIFLTNDNSICDINTSYRIDSKKVSINNSDINNIVDNFYIKEKTKGEALFKLYGYQATNDDRQANICKMFLNSIVDHNQKHLNFMNTQTTWVLIEELSYLKNKFDSYINSHDFLKINNEYYKSSISYNFNLEDLANKLNINKEIIINTIKDIDEIKTSTSKEFKENNPIRKESYYLENIFFIDINSKKFKNYIDKKQEIKEIFKQNTINKQEKIFI
ncbi:hypothetical protein [Campylobacter canadensis]|uniref:hypothetical protein n=1 Tax=Campylobacter canadensis TaxID=449520 RepID=UPI001CD0377C|nr:hypothetical protein [Campylobacter canadensis]MBZ8002358.1 hypothetical protein [Campylobacter canadensis]